MEALYTYVIGPLLGSVATALTFFLTGYRKQKVEVKGEEVKNKGLEFQNFEQYLEASNVMMADLKSQIKELIESNQKMRENNQILQDKVTALTRSNNKLCKEITELKDSLCTDCPRNKQINHEA